MKRTTATQLKEKLGYYMRTVRGGEEVVITDRDVPVARLVPFRKDAASESALVIARPRDDAAPSPAKLRIKGIRYKGTSSTKLLRQDRGSR